MAIQLRSIGANDNILSVSFSAGVGGESSKLTLVKLITSDAASPTLNELTTINFAGMNFIGYLIAYSRSDEPGKKTITLTYSDSSIDLDRQSVVLYKRGITSDEEEYEIEKDVTVPLITFTYGGGTTIPLDEGASIPSGSFNFSTRTEAVTVTRYRAKASARDQGILGAEEWSASPCDSSAAKYYISEFFDMLVQKNLFESTELVNLPNDFTCSYEGSFRSVISNIMGQVGMSWWWDWSIGKIKIFSVTNNGVIPDVPDACAIFKKEEGKTMEGLSTVSSWQYQRAYPRGIRSNQSARKTVIIYQTADTAAVKHPNFPSEEQMKEEAIPSYREYKAYTSGNLAPIGKRVTLNFINQFILDWSAIAVFKGAAWIVDFCETFGVDVDFFGNTFGIIAGSLDFKTTCYVLMGAHLNRNSVQILGGWDIDQSEKETETEIFYPAPILNSHDFIGNSTAWRTRDIEISPSPERRGLNPYANTYEDDNGIVRIGTWRSGSVESYGDTDSPIWGESTGDCLRTCSPDVLAYILDGPNAYREGTGGWRNLFNSGFQVWSLANPDPMWSTFGEGGDLENQNDTTSVAGWTNPNDLPPTVTEEEQEAEENAQEYDDPCESLVSDLQDRLQGDSLSEEMIIGDEDAKPGIIAANGGGSGASCGGASVSVAFPSLAPYRWVIKTTLEYSVIAEAFRAGETITNTWTKVGDTSNFKGLSHQIVMTDMTSDETAPTEIDIPSSIIDIEPLRTLDITTDGFSMPITNTLQAMSANIDYNGLSVSYSYKQIAPQQVSQRNIIAAGSYNVDVNLS
jgi:hypothetical protein